MAKITNINCRAGTAAGSSGSEDRRKCRRATRNVGANASTASAGEHHADQRDRQMGEPGALSEGRMSAAGSPCLWRAPERKPPTAKCRREGARTISETPAEEVAGPVFGARHGVATPPYTRAGANAREVQRSSHGRRLCASRRSLNDRARLARNADACGSIASSGAVSRRYDCSRSAERLDAQRRRPCELFTHARCAGSSICAGVATPWRAQDGSADLFEQESGYGSCPSLRHFAVVACARRSHSKASLRRTCLPR